MRAAIAVAVLGVLLRLVALQGADRALFSDERDYDRLARALAATGRYEDDGRPTAYRTIGYPAFVAAVYRVAGPRPEAVRNVQAFLDAGTALLLYALLRRRGERAALGAAALWAAFPPAILYARMIRPETIGCFLLVAAALGVTREGALSWTRRFLLGALWGAVALVKPEFVGVIAAAPLLVSPGPRRAGRAAVLLAGALLVVGASILRNAVVVGSPTLSTSFGAVLLVGNHPRATGGYAPDVPDSMRPHAADERTASEEARRTAARYIAEHPGRFLAAVPRRWALTLAGESELVVSAFHSDPGDPATPFRAKARSLPLWLHLAVSGPYALLLLLGIVGFLAAPSAEARPFFLALVAMWLVAHGTTFGGSRYHFPWMPFLAAYSAAFLSDPRAARPALRGRTLLLAAGAALAAIVVWILEILVITGR